VDRATTNGGFPLPPRGEPTRVLALHHDACDGETRVRLPRVVPSRAVRRVVCDRCAQAYAPDRVSELGAARSSQPFWRRTPARSWRWLSLPAAALAVAGALVALQGGGDGPATAATPPGEEPAPPARDAAKATGGDGRRSAKAVRSDAQLISESTFQLALPAGWKRVAPSGGATFAAAAPGGDADVMLWVEHDPKLDFATFERRSLDQLESLAGSAGVVARNPGPTPATTSSVIAPTSAPADAPNYRVLISGGPGNYWYYLATTSWPGDEADAGVGLVTGSFLPRGGSR
jgi:hypothetical protein